MSRKIFSLFVHLLQSAPLVGEIVNNLPIVVSIRSPKPDGEPRRLMLPSVLSYKLLLSASGNRPVFLVLPSVLSYKLLQAKGSRSTSTCCCHPYSRTSCYGKTLVAIRTLVQAATRVSLHDHSRNRLLPSVLSYKLLRFSSVSPSSGYRCHPYSRTSCYQLRRRSLNNRTRVAIRTLVQAATAVALTGRRGYWLPSVLSYKLLRDNPATSPEHGKLPSVLSYKLLHYYY